MATKKAGEQPKKKKTLKELLASWFGSPEAQEIEAALAEDEELDPEAEEQDDETTESEYDPDDDGDDDSEDSDNNPDKDEDEEASAEEEGEDEEVEMTVLGKTYKGKEAIQAAISKLETTAKKQQNLLTAAQARINKTTEEVKNEIKSSFTPENSRRSNKAKTTENALPKSLMPQSALGKAAVEQSLKLNKKR